MMVRWFLILLTVLLACCSTLANAQVWRSSQPSLLAQSGQNTRLPITGNTTSPLWPQGQAANMQQASPMFPNRNDYSSGNYDLPAQAANSIKSTRQTQFDIPFEISAANQSKYASIELIYSMDRGQTWYNYESVATDKKAFAFNAPEDAEYWFAFRAALKTGEIQQVGRVPAAQIIVDTCPPQLTLEARRNASGEANIAWSAEDVALKNTLPEISLSYDSNITWERLAVNPKSVTREGNRVAGLIVFWPRHSAEAVDIRCELEDAAGNKEIQTTRLILKQPADIAVADSDATPATASNIVGGKTTFATSGTSDLYAMGDMPVTPPRPVVSQKPIAHEQHATSMPTLGNAVPTPEMPVAENSVTGTLAVTTSDDATIETAETVEPVPNLAAGAETLSENVDTQLLDLLRNMGGTPPSAISADVARPYADNRISPQFGNVSSSTAQNEQANLPGVLSNVPPARFVPTNNTAGRAHLPQSATQAQTIGANAQASEGTNEQAVRQNTTDEAFPGKISLVSLGKFGEEDCIIVGWLPGDATFADGKIDLYRSNTRYGPWRAIAFDLQNTGSHYWLISAEDKMPFYLRVDLRSRQGLFTGFTTRAIVTPLSFSEQTPPNETLPNETTSSDLTPSATSNVTPDVAPSDINQSR